MLESKDSRTERLRELLASSENVRETSRADSGLSNLSYQSLRYSQRHVWIDTDFDGSLKIDLEDWDYDGSWDNSVAHMTSDGLVVCAAIVAAWLNGKTVDECRSLGGTDIDVI